MLPILTEAFLAAAVAVAVAVAAVAVITIPVLLSVTGRCLRKEPLSGVSGKWLVVDRQG